MFMECPHLQLATCTDCEGTGVRGAKKNGKKKCRTCGETLHPGRVSVCVSTSEPCMYCPRNAALQAPTPKSES
jgi:hypothetical protein